MHGNTFDVCVQLGSCQHVICLTAGAGSRPLVAKKELRKVSLSEGFRRMQVVEARDEFSDSDEAFDDLPGGVLEV